MPSATASTQGPPRRRLAPLPQELPPLRPPLRPSSLRQDPHSPPQPRRLRCTAALPPPAQLQSNALGPSACSANTPVPLWYTPQACPTPPPPPSPSPPPKLGSPRSGEAGASRGALSHSGRGALEPAPLTHGPTPHSDTVTPFASSSKRSPYSDTRPSPSRVLAQMALPLFGQRGHSGPPLPRQPPGPGASPPSSASARQKKGASSHSRPARSPSRSASSPPPAHPPLCTRDTALNTDTPLPSAGGSGGGERGRGHKGEWGGGEATESVELHEEMEQSYVAYAMSVIVGRALPDARDGLKPVHRRVLYVQCSM